MINLKEYADVIREAVAKESEKDPNWKWSVKSIGKTVVRIKWSYWNEYLEDPKTFSIATESGSVLDETIIWRDPFGDMIDYAVIGDSDIGVTLTVESALKRAVHRIARHAHSRY